MSIGPRESDITVALDNDVLSDWRFGKPATLKAIDQYVAAVKAPPAIPSITIFETMHGFEKAALKSGEVNEQTSLAKDRVRKLIDVCTILPFNQDAAEIAAYIFPRLSQSERNKHWTDVFIAATALAHDYGVATRNLTDYELIAKHAPTSYPTLRIEVWKTA